MGNLLLRVELARAIRRVAPTFATLVSPEALVGSLSSMPERAREELVAILNQQAQPQREHAQ